MILGGYSTAALVSVELHNWKTGQQCFTTNLPYGVYYHSGVVMEQTPAFCGYFVSTCYKFDVATKQWIPVRIL